MKQEIKKWHQCLLTSIVLFSISMSSFAYSFLANGIYYQITNATNYEVGVTYKEYISGDYFDDPEYISVYQGTVTIPSYVSYNGITYKVTSICDHAFDDCNVTSVIMPNTVVSIGNAAFTYCPSLSTITVSNTLTTIGSSAFSGCSSLQNISLPQSLTFIGSYAFQNCSSLHSISLPESLTTIGSSVFTGSGIQEPITYGNQLIFVPTSFEGEYHIPMRITKLSGGVFRDCTKLTSVIIPYGVTEIPSSAFSGCTSLKSVSIPSSVNYIGSKAFAYCSSLKECIIPSTVTNIWDAFNSCFSLESLILPAAMNTSVYDYAFYGCENLKSITFPKGVENIRLWAFYNTPYQNVEVFNFASCLPGQSEGPTGINPSKIHVPAGWTSSGVYSPISGTLVYDLQSITSLSISKTSLTMTDGGTTTLSCSVAPSNASVKTLHWSSNNTDVAVVDNNGKVTALSRGKATITASTLDGSNISASCTVTVKTLTYDIDEASATSFVSTETSDYSQITYTRNFKNTGWQELYVPFAMSYNDWKDDFEVGYIEGFLSRDTNNDGEIDETIWSGVKITEGTLLPNTPYIIRAKTTGNKTITLNNATLYATEENSIDCSSTTMRYVFKGVYESESYASVDDYPYYLNNGVFNMVPRIVPFRWTLRFESRGTSFVIHPNLTRGMVRENDGTPFEEYVENNQDLFVGYKVYTLDGRMIDMTSETLKPGFYVKNGKKILVK